jgi:hypothetical protein
VLNGLHGQNGIAVGANALPGASITTARELVKASKRKQTGYITLQRPATTLSIRNKRPGHFTDDDGERYYIRTASEQLEIICLIERTHLTAHRMLETLPSCTPPSTAR